MKRKFDNLQINESFFKNNNQIFFENVLTNFNNKLLFFRKLNIEYNFLFLSIFCLILFFILKNNIFLVIFAFFALIVSIKYYKFKKILNDFY